MKQLLAVFLLALCLSVHSQDIEAQSAGLNFQTYAAGGPMPGYTQAADRTINNRTLLSSGTVSTVNYQWGGGTVLNSGRNEGVIVRFHGFINIPSAGTYSFGGNADDGIRIRVNNTQVVDSWIESGGAFREGSVSLPAGVVAIELIYYENGGGAMVNLQWFMNGSWQIIPSNVLATHSTVFAPPAPVLCCGASSAAFSVNATHQAKINTFVNRTPQDSKVSIEQIGNSNTILVNQTGTEDNSVQYTGNGSFNTVTITQSGTNATVANYAEVAVTGNSNTVNLTQQSTGGTKSAFITVNNNNNTITAQQKDSGSHYLNLTVSGGNKTVDVLQQGSANHMANVSLSGNQTGLNLTQSGSQQQFYSINHTCSTAGGCGTITVQQGQ
jgi:hypothetical protein